MISSRAARFTRRLSYALALLMAAEVVSGQQQPPAAAYQPRSGQPGKDVVWVPTPQRLVEKMLDIARVTPADLVTDLGSGDGRTVLAAAGRGARAVGIEFNPELVALSRQAAAAAGLAEKAEFVTADLFDTDLSRATVITMFLLPEINLRLRPKLLDLKPGTRVVSNTFTMGEWLADEVAAIGDCPVWCTALLWIVPAKADGPWRTADGGELVLRQDFQFVSGTLTNGGVATAVQDGRLRGEELTFTAGGVAYTGRVTPGSIEGTARAGDTTTPWRAQRVTGARYSWWRAITGSTLDARQAGR